MKRIWINYDSKIALTDTVASRRIPNRIAWKSEICDGGGMLYVTFVDSDMCREI